MSRRLRFAALCLVAAILFASCASDPHLRSAHSNETAGTPRAIQLEAEQSISTIHFPPGIYSLEEVDDTGYYYRAPQSVQKHSFAGSDPYDGGIFVRKGTPLRLRGYVIWAGGRTKIGNLSRAKYTFRN